MIRRKDKITIKTPIPRGGFETALSPAITSSISGRGVVSHDTTNNVKFEPPMKSEETSKPKKMKNGMYAMKKKIKQDDSKKANDAPYDDNMNINWDYLEERRKRKPCKKLIKKLQKGQA